MASRRATAAGEEMAQSKDGSAGEGLEMAARVFIDGFLARRIDGDLLGSQDINLFFELIEI